MNKCKRCGSHAINENEHGREPGKDLDLCDVCYWRNVAESNNDGNEWTRDWPTEPGSYWFYGYRYGRVSCGYEKDRELCSVVVKKISNGVMLIESGSFMHREEPEDYFFKKAVSPDLPE